MSYGKEFTLSNKTYLVEHTGGALRDDYDHYYIAEKINDSEYKAIFEGSVPQSSYDSKLTFEQNMFNRLKESIPYAVSNFQCEDGVELEAQLTAENKIVWSGEDIILQSNQEGYPDVSKMEELDNQRKGDISFSLAEEAAEISKKEQQQDKIFN